MLEYARELIFEFYTNADGILIESSDYAICHCDDCGERFFEREFQFVRQISNDLWAKKPSATIVVFPHYFSGANVPGFGVKAAKLPFDPRWSLVFTPHSANPKPSLIKQARSTLWWDDSPSLRGPRQIQAGAKRARDLAVTGYIPSLEAFTFVATEAEEGQPWLKGKRQIPLGFPWLDPAVPPFDEPPIRVNRIAYREFTRNPDFTFDAYKQTLARDLFPAPVSNQTVDDALTLQSVLNLDRTWCQPSPVVASDRLHAMQARGELTQEKRERYHHALNQLQTIADRHKDAQTPPEQTLNRLAVDSLNALSPSDRASLAPK